MIHSAPGREWARSAGYCRPHCIQKMSTTMVEEPDRADWLVHLMFQTQTNIVATLTRNGTGATFDQN
jgi:hypothetical protein